MSGNDKDMKGATTGAAVALVVMVFLSSVLFVLAFAFGMGWNLACCLFGGN